MSFPIIGDFLKFHGAIKSVVLTKEAAEYLMEQCKGLYTPTKYFEPLPEKCIGRIAGIEFYHE
jgi:hypothetical protein